MTHIIKFNQVYLAQASFFAPPLTLSTQDIAGQQAYPGTINPGASLGIIKKTIPAADQDSLTLAVQAAWPLVKNQSTQIMACYFGSESPPYAVKSTITLLSNFLNLSPNLFGADLEFACRAGLEAVIAAANFVQAHRQTALAIGSDTAQAKPGDILEFIAAAGASAWLLSPHKTKSCLKLSAACAYTTDTPDFWRFQNSPYPYHAGRFTGQPAYFHHLETVFTSLTTSLNLKSSDFAKVAIHAPNLKFPLRLAKKLNFTRAQIDPLWVDKHGNPYTASVMIQTVLKAKKLKSGQNLLVLSFGSGAGSLALILKKL
ncbi:MAG: hydroxymethylglutaryl-CoA synthase [bacterium]|nr:hydroxymethylglutaryl-CoA synthase [bacterium]